MENTRRNRQSLNFSVLRGSQSPERRPHNDSRSSLHASRVELAEIADLELSRDDISVQSQTERDAESIYLIIQEYSDRPRTFHFSEIFEDGVNVAGSAHSNSNPTLRHSSQSGNLNTSVNTSSSGEYVDSRSHPAPIPPATAPGVHAGRPLLQAARVLQISQTLNTAKSELASPAPYAASLSSGELLSQLETKDPCARDSKGYPYPQDPSVPPSGYNTGSLTAGIDSSSELPITLYTVQDHASPASRWSVYEAQKMKASGRPVNVPKPVYMPIKDGSNSARRISILTDSSRKSLRNSIQISLPHHNLPNPSLLTLDRVGSLGSRRSNGSRVSPSFNVQDSPSLPPKGPMQAAENRTQPLLGRLSNGSSDILLLPSSMVRDSDDKLHYHEQMFGGRADLIFADENGSYASSEDLESRKSYMGGYYTWSKWVFVMCTGLLAVPVFFLLALGVFDHGGFSQAGFLEKNGTLTRYHRRYLPAQKAASAILGLLWIAVVFLMIAVGFAVGLRS